ncbi:right-handed parallel beta-helix repeat-containing protein [Niabella drilacis]|uniref:Right handed beta helix region n=1 Tax=Niabella drilacis (strain DSM 25811 / CCM 8410 / CCUG 62505 / LMG 26954 / E90) TaxID=1285928 RepID=A0A1G6R5M6_NIADE|nr:right-handed parallel beta-helix repeat-containing protein [Niabella drilacis]SDC99922.1 Right handed beta helix region [Niabella drilacis]
MILKQTIHRIKTARLTTVRCGWLLLLCLFYCFQLPARVPAVLHAEDYGVKANSYENAAPALQRAIAACRRHPAAILKLPQGRIDVWPDGAAKRELYISNSTESDTLSKIKSIAFLLEDCANITIDGSNSLIMLHGKMVSFAILRSQNIRIEQIRFDYERPTMSELTVTAVQERSVEVRLHPDSRFTVDSGKLVLFGEGWKTEHDHTLRFDPLEDRMYYSSLKPLQQAVARQTGPNTVVFEGDFKKPPYKPGNVLTVRDPYRDNCGGLIAQSKNTVLEHVKMYYMHGLGIVSQFSENITLRKVAVAPPPGSGRVIAAFADCFHFSGCRGKVLIDSCYTSGAHDDPINVHGTHLQITGMGQNGKLTVRFMHHQTYGFPAFFAGDSIAFVDPKTLLPVAWARLQSATLVNKKEMELRLSGAIPEGVTVGLCIENRTWTPEVVIRNSRFERTNTRGLLITTPRKVLVEGNTFYHTGMFPILIADDASSWFESGAVQDVTIRNNVFDGCGYNSGSGAINIAPENHVKVPGRYVHRNIRILDNTFNTRDGKLLSARSVDGLLFTGNKITGLPSMDQEHLLKPVWLADCKNVRIQKNVMADATGLTVELSGMTEKDIKTDWKLLVK